MLLPEASSTEDSWAVQVSTPSVVVMGEGVVLVVVVKVSAFSPDTGRVGLCGSCCCCSCIRAEGVIVIGTGTLCLLVEVEDEVEVVVVVLKALLRWVGLAALLLDAGTAEGPARLLAAFDASRRVSCS